ncbi:hypothetical protein [Kaarinaea lacus]
MITKIVKTNDHANDICSIYQYMVEIAINDANKAVNPPIKCRHSTVDRVPSATASAQWINFLLGALNTVAAIFTGIVVKIINIREISHHESVEKLTLINSLISKIDHIFFTWSSVLPIRVYDALSSRLSYV